MIPDWQTKISSPQAHVVAREMMRVICRVWLLLNQPPSLLNQPPLMGKGRFECITQASCMKFSLHCTLHLYGWPWDMEKRVTQRQCCKSCSWQSTFLDFTAQSRRELREATLQLTHSVSWFFRRLFGVFADITTCICCLMTEWWAARHPRSHSPLQGSHSLLRQ
jgi:hypothetical protein